MGIHTEEQLEDKRLAIDLASERFAIMFLQEGIEDERLYFEIESLFQLVQELKRG